MLLEEPSPRWPRPVESLVLFQCDTCCHCISVGERIVISHSSIPTATGGSVEAALGTHCPICLENWDSVAYTMPCCHQFCFHCIQRGTSSRPQSPLCKTRGGGGFLAEGWGGRGHHCCLPVPGAASDLGLSLSLLQFVIPSACCSTSEGSSFPTSALPSPP